MTTLGGERIRVAFNLILDDMCDSEAVRRPGKEMWEVLKNVFQ